MKHYVFPPTIIDADVTETRFAKCTVISFTRPGQKIKVIFVPTQEHNLGLFFHFFSRLSTDQLARKINKKGSATSALFAHPLHKLTQSYTKQMVFAWPCLMVYTHAAQCE